MTSTHWQTDQIVWWKGSSINRQSKEFQNLIRRAYQAMFEQNERFRIALMSTRGIKLYHSQGEQNPYKTILTESEFCSVLTEMRDSYDINNNETPQRKKRLYFDMDGFWLILNLHWRSKTNRRSKNMKADMMRYRGCLGRCCQCTEQ